MYLRNLVGKALPKDSFMILNTVSSSYKSFEYNIFNSYALWTECGFGSRTEANVLNRIHYFQLIITDTYYLSGTGNSLVRTLIHPNKNHRGSCLKCIFLSLKHSTESESLWENPINLYF
jgi:hypothetical protein